MEIKRREFLKTSLKTIAIGTIAVNTIDLKKLIAGTNSDTGEINAKVINLSDYPALQGVGGNAQIGKAMVFRNSDTKFSAISTICTHKKCDIDFTGDGFECPCHGSAFSKAGKVLNGPATKNLRSYKTSFNAETNELTINM